MEVLCTRRAERSLTHFAWTRPWDSAVTVGRMLVCRTPVVCLTRAAIMYVVLFLARNFRLGTGVMTYGPPCFSQKLHRVSSCAYFVLPPHRWPYSLCCRSNSVHTRMAVCSVRERIPCLYSTYRMSNTSVCETHWCAYALFLSRRMIFCARKHSVS